MWRQMEQTWASMFEFFEVSSAPDADTDCAVIYAADIAANPHMAASSLELRIPTALFIQQLWGCTLEKTSGLMGHN